MEDTSGGRRTLKKIFMFLLVTALAVTVVVCGVSFGEERRVPIYGVDTDKKQVAISFDAAWGDEFTEGILDILETYDVKATFFLVDFWAKDYPDDVKLIASRGHDIGNHSTTHPDMANLSEQEISQELNTTAETIESLTGKRPTLFRPPYGSYSDRLINTADSLGYQTIQWSVDACASEEKQGGICFKWGRDIWRLLYGFPIYVDFSAADFDSVDQRGDGFFFLL